MYIVNIYIYNLIKFIFCYIAIPDHLAMYIFILKIICELFPVNCK